jgi:hypothetical protein
MTTDDQDAEVGRLVRERRELRAQHQALVSKAEKLAKLLSSIGHAIPLRRNPIGDSPTLNFESDGSVTVSDQYHNQNLLKGAFPSVIDMVTLLDDLRRCEARLAELDTQLRNFGA